MSKWICGLIFLLVVSPSWAQKNEFAVLGSSFQTSASFNVHGGEGLQINYAHRLVDVKLAALYLELPFEAGWGGSRSITQGNLLHENYNTMYLTPGLKLKISAHVVHLAVPCGWNGLGRVSLDEHQCNLEQVRGGHWRRSGLYDPADSEPAGRGARLLEQRSYAGCALRLSREHQQRGDQRRSSISVLGPAKYSCATV